MMISPRHIRYALIDAGDWLRFRLTPAPRPPPARATVSLRPSWRVWWALWHRLIIGMAALLGLITLALAAAWSIYRALPPATPAAQAQQPTSALIMVISTPVPTAVPLPTAAPRMVTAYDQPNGAALGPIPEPSARAIVARWGDAWLQTTWDNAPVWILAADLGANLADVRPVPSVVIAPVDAPGMAEPAYHVASDPQPSGIALTERQRADAFAAHNARQIAWCADKETDYCAMVRAAVVH
jgi:hypothetical protein